MKRLLGDTERAWPTTLRSFSRTNANALALFNCSFFGVDSNPSLNLMGAGLRIENNAFEWIDWRCRGRLRTCPRPAAAGKD